MMGTVMPERFPNRLNTPLVNPMRCFGAMADTNDQLMEAMPFPKKAVAMKTMIHLGACTKLAPMMVVERSSPVTIGALRATPIETPFRSSRSDTRPEHRTPQNAARNGNDERKPAVLKLTPRYFTR